MKFIIKKKKKGVNKAFSINKCGIAEDFEDIKKRNTVKVAWGYKVEVRKRG